MSKYQRLEAFLAEQGSREVPMTFAGVERVLGFKLPRSAYAHRPWWANDTNGHVQSRAWLDAGFQTERVDVAGERLVFVRRAGAGDDTASVGQAGDPASHPLVGALAGLVRIPPGLDLTPPAEPDWSRLFDAKWADRKPGTL